MPKKTGKPSQTWMTFLRNHVGQMVSVDFFTVPTIQLRVLYVFIILAHDRRRVLHFNVTENPTAAWTAQQIVEAFPGGNGASRRRVCRWIRMPRNPDPFRIYRLAGSFKSGKSADCIIATNAGPHSW
jgi:hypothetical protein